MFHAPQCSAKEATAAVASFKPTFEVNGFHLHVVRSIVVWEVLRIKISWFSSIESHKVSSCTVCISLIFNGTNFLQNYSVYLFSVHVCVYTYIHVWYMYVRVHTHKTYRAVKLVCFFFFTKDLPIHEGNPMSRLLSFCYKNSHHLLQSQSHIPIGQ